MTVKKTANNISRLICHLFSFSWIKSTYDEFLIIQKKYAIIPPVIQSVLFRKSEATAPSEICEIGVIGKKMPKASMPLSFIVILYVPH